MFRADGEAKAQFRKANCKYEADFIFTISGLDVERRCGSHVLGDLYYRIIALTQLGYGRGRTVAAKRKRINCRY